MRPDVPDPSQMPGKMRRFMDQRRGTELVIKEWILPALRDSFDDLMKAADSADAIVSHTLTFAVPLVAELRSITWISIALQPGALFSVHDPPLVAQTAPFVGASFLGPWFWRHYRRLVNGIAKGWFAPLRAARGTWMPSRGDCPAARWSFPVARTGVVLSPSCPSAT